MADNSSKLLWVILHVTCKNEEDPFKHEGARVVIKDLPFKFMQIFYDAQGQLTPQSEVGST